MLMALVTLYSGILNALGRFAAAAAAPILLNLAMMVALALRRLFFPPPGTPPPGACCSPGCLEVLLVAGDAAPQRRAPTRCAGRASMRRSSASSIALGPATLGSAETQLALFADTIIASFLAAGALSALYYADRLNQLPIGVIGIAAGTVLLPEMARRIAAGDERARATRRTARSS